MTTPEIIIHIVWAVGASIGCAVTWYKSAVQLAEGQDPWEVKDRAAMCYLLSLTWVFVLILIPIFLPLFGLIKLSTYLRTKLIKRLKAR